MNSSILNKQNKVHLLRLLRSRIRSQEYITGLCQIADDLHSNGKIHNQELNYLYDYIQDHRPWRVRIFPTTYYWFEGVKTLRLYWIWRQIVYTKIRNFFTI